MDNRIQICEQIAEDVKNDAENFDGKPFNGRTMAEYMGYHGAAIVSLANLLKSVLEELPNSEQEDKRSVATEDK